MSFATFRTFLELNGVEERFAEILAKMKSYSYIALSSVKSKINSKQRRYSFQLFGFDYIVDSAYKVWLI